MTKAPFHVDPTDPRAPSQSVWDAMSAAEQARVIAMLPNEVSIEEMSPEGDHHQREDAEQKRQDAEQKRQDAEQKRQDAEHRADAAERRLAQALAEIERLKSR